MGLLEGLAFHEDVGGALEGGEVFFNGELLYFFKIL